jgi:membrane-bound lytic murein transglycosylase B
VTSAARQKAKRIAAAVLGAALCVMSSAAAGDADAGASDAPGFDLARPEIAAFIDRVVARDGFARDQLTAAMAAAKVRPELTAEMRHAPEKLLDWWQYRQRFVTPRRIENGVRFWREHQADVESAASGSGVAPEYLVAILGIETNYGEITGGYREIDTLMTYAFDYPERSRFFRSELRQFLLLARELGRDPLAIRGSYGGALGVPQMMPSNYRRFAAGRPGGATVDLWTDWSAILTGLAEFLHRRGWVKDGPVLVDGHARDGVDVPAASHFALDDTIATLRAKGVSIDIALPGRTPVVLVPAALEHGIQYRVGFRNFYVITRYNPRVNYAMAVCDLAQHIRNAFSEPQR